jgi:hypothetical protein
VYYLALKQINNRYCMILQEGFFKCCKTFGTSGIVVIGHEVKGPLLVILLEVVVHNTIAIGLVNP